MKTYATNEESLATAKHAADQPQPNPTGHRSARHDAGLVHVVDDDSDFRTGLELLLRSAGFRVASYSSGDHFMSIYRPREVECLLLDVRMPGMSGLELQRELARRRIDVPLIVISAFAEAPAVVEAMKNGAVDFLEKPIEQQTLVEKVSRALEVARESRRQQATLRVRLDKLTPREREVMNLLVEAKATREVARELDVTAKTIEKHRVNIFRKLDVDTVAELILLVVGRPGADKLDESLP